MQNAGHTGQIKGSKAGAVCIYLLRKGKRWRLLSRAQSSSFCHLTVQLPGQLLSVSIPGKWVSLLEEATMVCGTQSTLRVPVSASISYWWAISEFFFKNSPFSTKESYPKVIHIHIEVGLYIAAMGNKQQKAERLIRDNLKGHPKHVDLCRTGWTICLTTADFSLCPSWFVHPLQSSKTVLARSPPGTSLPLSICF